MSEYVLSQEEQESSAGSSVNTPTSSNSNSSSRRRRRLRRHVLAQESYEAASPAGSEGCRAVERRTSSLEKYSNLNTKLY